MIDIHKRISQLMEEHGWTKYRLSKQCGLSEATIVNIFRRNAVPSIYTIEAICNGFGITISQFFAEDESVELSPELRELFDAWLFLTPTQKAAILQTIKEMNN